MKFAVSVALVLSSVTLAACAPAGTSYPSAQARADEASRQLDALIAENRGKLDAALAAYAVAPACADPAFDEAMSKARILEVGIETDDLTLLQSFRENRVYAGMSLNRLGDDAVKKKCRIEARTAFLTVIETFTGSFYTAIRQRAQIGLDDVRAMH
jgi:hypothetical protein